MLEHYIAKVWLGTPMSMDEIADRLGMQDVKKFTTDVVGTRYVGRVGDRLWILHQSWGTPEAAEKIKVYAVPGMSAREAEITVSTISRLLNSSTTTKGLE